jgi:indole-3-glycerol phosphate synthase
MTKAVPDILAQIVEQKKRDLGAVTEELERRADLATAGRRNFLPALTSARPAIIAEIKKASPSKGLIAPEFDPRLIAMSYERGGAAAISVLTDGPNFQGSLDHLEAARNTVHLPVLRKDFTIDRYHVIEAAASGADAILLIAAILSERQMRDFRELAARYGMASLVEVHDEEELPAAIASGARIIGVNNRDLRNFQVDLGVSLRLADNIPSHVVKVAESGIHTPEDIRRLQSAGFQAFLVGEHLMKSGNPQKALAALLS